MSGKPPFDTKQIAALVGAVVVALTGGTGAGYALHGSSAEAGQSTAAFPMDRGVAMEQWRAGLDAARDVVAKRDADERTALVSTVKELTTAVGSLRDAVLLTTERMAAMDRRLVSLESGGVRPASGKRP